MVELSAETEALWQRMAHVLDQGRSGASVLEGLRRLLALAPEPSEPWLFACSRLAERIATQDPWQASIMARRVITHRPGDDAPWGVLGLAQSLMGHHQYAIRAYRRALHLAPHNPWYAHNLGHLYDVVLDHPGRALPWLEHALDQLAGLRIGDDEALAERAERARPEVVASYAHALMRRGRAAEARQVMREVVRGRATPAQHELYSQILAVEDRQLQQTLAMTPEPPRRPVRKRRRTRSAGG